MSCLSCGYVAPRVADLLEPNDGSLVDMETGAPLTAAEMRAWYDRAVAGGAEPGDSLARWS